MRKNEVLIIMPCFNAERFVGDAIKSILNQSYKDWKLIIIDDCSTDGTLNKIFEIKDSRIEFIINERNEGVALTRNKGLAQARSGDFVFFIDSDDIWENEKLELQVKRLNGGDKVVVSEYIYTGNNENIIKTDLDVLDMKGFINKKYRVCFSSIGFVYNDKFRFTKVGHEDFVFIIQILNEYKYINIIHKALVNMVKVDGSLSSNKRVAAKWHWKNLRNIHKGNVMASLFSMLMYIYRGFLFSLKNK
ncbi:family 2 glycosyl transferase [Tatumella ptyseos ATCC 33301]|uniref:Family 2 glycosyl transferase n=2 Tax=Tatumella ptyseos TaxID=82987 RepID=A0A085JA82_9GAMM|nr:glycosyltransferase family 2 protein [Tatumella ptyseos]KFD17378.1 family 2 glycosyl transferase [Tatumella ptyseos ATCC 33301]